MTIERHENEKELFDKFQEDTLKCFSLAPGVVKNRHYFSAPNHYSFMCSLEIKKEIEKTFGKSNRLVTGKVNKANFYAFTFNEKIILCTCEKEIGTSWYWADSTEEGSRYGNPMLLSWDKEVKDFWPEFCSEFKIITDKNLTSNKKPKI